MELPFSTQGRKATHDFLSLYSSSSSHVQDPPPPQGGYLKTHNFLQPLERVGKTAMASKEEGTHEMAAVEKPPTSVEQLLPGGIGTYTISYFNQSTTRHDDNSSSSYQGSGFTLWDESSSVNKGKTGKENILDTHVVPGRQWASSSQKKQSFMEMIASAKNDQDDDDDEEEDEFVIKKETSFSSHQKGNLLIKVEAHTIDQKPNTPRSKHSATEQRRRSKINDRFQKLREVIPKVDQKKDKASFLLEVIEYIQLLQEKVNRYETSYDLWSHEPSKMMQRRNCNIAEGLVDHLPVAKTECSPALVDTNKPGASPSTANESGGQQPELASRATPVHPTMQPKILVLGRTGFPTSPVSLKQASNTDQTMTWHPSQFHQKRPPTIESGTINISSAYSLGLLNSLTQALSKSGVDLSQASISVKIDLQDKASGIPQFSSPASKDNGSPAGATHARATREDFTNALKKLRTS